MIRLLKRLAILVGLWLGVSVAGVVYINTRSPEQFEADVRAVLEPTLGVLDETLEAAMKINSVEFEPLPDDDAMRAEIDSTRAEVLALYDDLIATREALQEAHSDEWEKRWAGDAVTIARMDKERAVEAIEMDRRDVDNPSGRRSGDMAPERISARLDKARITAEMQKLFVENELAIARDNLQDLRDGSEDQDSF
jgi:hypothetical protein